MSCDESRINPELNLNVPVMKWLQTHLLIFSEYMQAEGKASSNAVQFSIKKKEKNQSRKCTIH